MGDLSATTAVVLAGGLGTRLRAAVRDRPKGLAQIGGRPFLAYLLDQLDSAGVRKTVLCTGYLGEEVKETFGGEYRGLQLAYSQERSPLGTGGALRLAVPLLASDPVLVLNGDSYCEADLPAFRDWHARTAPRPRCSLPACRIRGAMGESTMDGNGAVVSFRGERGRPAGPAGSMPASTSSAAGSCGASRQRAPCRWSGRSSRPGSAADCPVARARGVFSTSAPGIVRRRRGFLCG